MNIKNLTIEETEPGLMLMGIFLVNIMGIVFLF